MTPSRLAAAAAFAALAALPARAQETLRIVAATIYPDGASVERELKVPGGARHVTMACVPGSVDVSTLQVDGDPELRMVELRVVDLPARRWTECGADADTGRATALRDRLAALEAQHQADDIALAYLRQWSSRPPETPAPAKAAGEAAPPAATAQSLRRAALELVADQSRVAREIEDVKEERSTLDGDAARRTGHAGWRTVRFEVWTPAAATLRVRTLVVGAHWTPGYRAAVDTAHATLTLERQADILQATGEDWTNVRVRLSTGRPGAALAGAPPVPWFVDQAAPIRRSAEAFYSAPPPAAPVAAVAPPSQGGPRRPQAPDWSATLQDGEYATEFVLAQPLTIAADGESHQVAIESRQLPVTLRARTTPRNEAAVYLVAEAARPEGVWPSGPLQAVRDGTFAGSTAWSPAQGDTLQVPLGRDDRMQVVVESPGRFTAGAGLFDSRVERTAKGAYTVTNRHETPVTLELLDAAPVSRDEKITVRSTYDPAPATTDWDRQAGMTAWTLVVPPGHKQRVQVSHVVSYPKDMAVTNLP